MFLKGMTHIGLSTSYPKTIRDSRTAILIVQAQMISLIAADGVEKNQRKFENFSTLISKKSSI